jgi:CarD family transcriptional regulator, regulator of rRNA transcription
VLFCGLVGQEAERCRTVRSVALCAPPEDDRRDVFGEGHLGGRWNRRERKYAENESYLLVYQSFTDKVELAVTFVTRANKRRKHAVFCHIPLLSWPFPQYTGKTFCITFAPSQAPHDGGTTVTFEVGDKVIYPNQGLGVVTRIEEKTILGTTCGFYHLRIVANETTVLVPIDNVDGVGLRRAIGDAEVERLFNALGNGKIDNHQNWKGRFKDNSDKMRTGSIYDVADVLKNLTLLSRSKSLSFREKRMLDRAKFLIVSEISEVMRETSESIEGRVEKALERSFTTRTRAIARAKAAKAAPPTAARTPARRAARAS